MRIGIGIANGSTTTPPMLGPCTTPGCTAIVFGRGTCVAHDPLGLLAFHGLRSASSLASSALRIPEADANRRNTPTTTAATADGNHHLDEFRRIEFG
jgi:hypothetical protein